MTQETKHMRKLYIATPDTIRGQEPRIRNSMPTLRDEDTAKEVAILVNYSAEDAENIVRAVNSHDALVEALEDVCNSVDDNGHINITYNTLYKCCAALAKARGEA